MPPDYLQDQLAQLKGQLAQAQDLVNAKQLELQAAQDQRQGIRDAITDLRAAYQAWKGVQP